MSSLHSEIKDRKGIEALGFEYAEDESKCRGHMFNDIPVEIDIREKPEYKLEDVDGDMDKVFKAVLQWELRDAGIKAIREVSWDRIFCLKNWWEPRDFIVRYWVRIVSEDFETNSDSHVQRA